MGEPAENPRVREARAEVRAALRAWREASDAPMPHDTLVPWLDAIRAAELRHRRAKSALREALRG